MSNSIIFQDSWFSGQAVITNYRCWSISMIEWKYCYISTLLVITNFKHKLFKILLEPTILKNCLQKSSDKKHKGETNYSRLNFFLFIVHS